jgi:hypothetical protein
LPTKFKQLFQANISDPIEAFLQVFLEILITLVFMAVIVLKRDEGFYNFERFLTAILVCENFIYVLGLPIKTSYQLVNHVVHL